MFSLDFSPSSDDHLQKPQKTNKNRKFHQTDFKNSINLLHL